jgi:hypothetical protein
MLKVISLMRLSNPGREGHTSERVHLLTTQHEPL